MSKQLAISCYIRTKNEEARIGEVIRAAFKVCSEVIVVDSESTDQTREIAKELGAKVILQPWLGNGKQKRVGEEVAKNDWLLDIDADEIVSDALAEEIRALFSDTSPQETGFLFKIVTEPPLGTTWHTCCLVHRVKLYNKTKARIPDHAAWDQFKITSEMKIKKLRGPLIHHSFSSVENLVGKLNRVSSVRAQEKKLKALPVVIIRIFFFFPIYFLRNYLKRNMWKHGVYSFSVAVISAAGRWLTDVKMYEIHKGLKK